MGILPVLLVIVAIASVVMNYNKIAKQRLEDEMKRVQRRRNAAGNPEPAAEARVAQGITNASAPRTEKESGLRETNTPKPRVSVKDMKSAVIMAEILNKPVSLREK